MDMGGVVGVGVADGVIDACAVSVRLREKSVASTAMRVIFCDSTKASAWRDSLAPGTAHISVENNKDTLKANKERDRRLSIKGFSSRIGARYPWSTHFWNNYPLYQRFLTHFVHNNKERASNPSYSTSLDCPL